VQQITRSRDIFTAFGIPIYESPGFEADDILGTIVATAREDKDLEVIIASGDMDTFQLVDKKRVRVYMQRKGSEIVMFDESAIKEKFGFGPTLTIDYKGLRGDTSDNIPGVKGVGETSAIKLVQTYGSLEKIYAAIDKDGVETVAHKSAVQKRFVQLVADGKDEAEFSKMLATIRDDAPIDFALPADEWRAGVDTDGVLALFSELGFRTLAARFRNMFALTAEPGMAVDGVGAKDQTKLAVMLWLLESDRTNVTFEDVLDYAQSVLGVSESSEIEAALTKRLQEAELWSVFTDIEQPLIEAVAYMNDLALPLILTT